MENHDRNREAEDGKKRSAVQSDKEMGVDVAGQQKKPGQWQAMLERKEEKNFTKAHEEANTRVYLLTE